MYLNEIQQHWKNTIAIAIKHEITALQIQALKSLAEIEFGAASNMRLRKENFWTTTVQDGNVVLTFLSVGAELAKLATITIDDRGILTQVCNGVVEVLDPHEEAKEWEDQFETDSVPRVWIISENMFRSFCEPSILVQEMHDDSCRITVAETAKVFQPVFSMASVSSDAAKSTRILTNTVYYDGPISGYAQHYGELCFFSQIYQDDVSFERVYGLYRLSLLQKARVHLQTAMWKLEVLVNANRKNWIRLPGRIDANELQNADALFAYSMNGKISGFEM